MIHYIDKGDLLASPADALVNPVNTVGVMGKGLASQFKNMYPKTFTAYAKACKQGEVKVGKMYITIDDHPKNGGCCKYIINFPTKKHWRQPSEYEYIRLGLIDLREQLIKLNPILVAIPPLGCGNGGLNRGTVKHMIVDHLGDLDSVKDIDVAIHLYGFS